MPGSSPTMARRSPTTRLKSVDLPTFGRPTIANNGSAPRDSDARTLSLSDSLDIARTPPRERAPRSPRAFPSLRSKLRRLPVRVECIPHRDAPQEGHSPGRENFLRPNSERDKPPPDLPLPSERAA